MVFSVESGWKWGEHKLPKMSSYSYLAIDFASIHIMEPAWDMCI